MVDFLIAMIYQNINFRIRLTFLAIMLCICITFLSCSARQEYDSFSSLNLILESNKQQFSIGDEIILTARITSNESKVVRIYKDRRKSFRIVVRRLLKNDSDPSDRDYYMDFSPSTKNDEIEIIYITPTKPFQFQIKGIIQQENYNTYFFNFDGFVKFKKDKLGKFYIGSAWLAINPEPGQSEEENYTNSLIINVEAPIQH